MGNNAKFVLKFSMLALPFVILTLLLHVDNATGGIGGGGYDLSGLVYGLLLFASTIIWLIWISISYAISRTENDRKLNLRLVIIGLIALIGAWIITPAVF